MERNTIAVVLKGYPRLSETFIAQELRALELAGFKLWLVSMRRPTDAKVHPIHREIEAPVVYLPEYLHEEPLRVLRGLAKVALRPGFRVALGRWLADLSRDLTRNRVRRFGQACVLAAEMPDDVAWLYAHFIHTPAAVTRYAAVLSGRAWSCSAHAKDIWTSSERDLGANVGAAEWVATCTAIGHRHLEALAGKPGHVHLIYHGLDLARFAADHDAAPGPPRDGRDPARPIRILSVGRAVEKKGLDTLLKALSLLSADLAWRFEHIGGGSEMDRLRRQAATLGIADRVDWRGAQDQSVVLAAYRTSDLFVLPCRIADDGDRDGLPNVLVEAQSQRLACISTPVSAVPELIGDGVTGRLVPPDDPRALADAIAALAQDPATRRRLGDAGEARVREAFDHTVGIAQLARLFPQDLRSANVVDPEAARLSGVTSQALVAGCCAAEVVP